MPASGREANQKSIWALILANRASRIDVGHFLSPRYFASTIRSARATAKQGDVFSPVVADLFRDLIANALVGHVPARCSRCGRRSLGPLTTES